MRWVVAVLIVVLSSFYLYHRFKSAQAPPPPPKIISPELTSRPEPESFLTLPEIGKIRRSTLDGDANVRWAAMALLYTLKEPNSINMLSKAVSSDPDPNIRLKALLLLRKSGDIRTIDLVKGLQDPEKSVKMASLDAISKIGDPAATPWVLNLLTDGDPDIRAGALEALSSMQENRKKEFLVLVQKLKDQYRKALAESEGKSVFSKYYSLPEEEDNGNGN